MNTFFPNVPIAVYSLPQLLRKLLAFNYASIRFLDKADEVWQA